MKHVLAVSSFFLFAQGCTNKKADSGLDGQSGNSSNSGGASLQPDDIEPESVTPVPVFEITGILLDLAIASDGRVFASNQEQAIEVWDPQTNWVTTHTDRAGPVFGVVWASDALWYTTSHDRHAGALMKLNGRDPERIADADGDTIFREPRDLCQAPDGSWVIADTTLSMLFVISPDGSTVEPLSVPQSDLSTVASDNTYIYAGGESGVIRIAWPNGPAETLDDRSVDGLHHANGILWGTNVDWGVFEVGGERRLDLPEIRRAGRMVGNDPLLIADSTRGDVWSVSLSGIE